MLERRAPEKPVNEVDDVAGFLEFQGVASRTTSHVEHAGRRPVAGTDPTISIVRRNSRLPRGLPETTRFVRARRNGVQSAEPWEKAPSSGGVASMLRTVASRSGGIIERRNQVSPVAIDAEVAQALLSASCN